METKGTGGSSWAALMGWLDRIHDLLTKLGSIAVLVLIMWGACRLARMETRQEAKEFLEAIEANWKAAALFVVVLFYRPLRGFLDRLERAWGLTARPPEGQPLGSHPEPSPPTSTQQETRE